MAWTTLILLIMVMQHILSIVDGGCATDVFETEKKTPSYCYKDLSNSVAPYELDIGTFNGGRRLFVGGEITKQRKFAVDLINENGNIAFHLDFRTNNVNNKLFIVANSRVNDKWYNEERHWFTDKTWPFVLNNPFCMEIIGTSNAIKVKVDKKHLLDFQYRNNIGNLESYQYLSVVGDVYLTEVTYTET